MRLLKFATQFLCALLLLFILCAIPYVVFGAYSSTKEYCSQLQDASMHMCVFEYLRIGLKVELRKVLLFPEFLNFQLGSPHRDMVFSSLFILSTLLVCFALVRAIVFLLKNIFVTSNVESLKLTTLNTFDVYRLSTTIIFLLALVIWILTNPASTSSYSGPDYLALPPESVHPVPLANSEKKIIPTPAEEKLANFSVKNCEENLNTKKFDWLTSETVETQGGEGYDGGTIFVAKVSIRLQNGELKRYETVTGPDGSFDFLREVNCAQHFLIFGETGYEYYNDKLINLFSGQEINYVNLSQRSPDNKFFLRAVSQVEATAGDIIELFGIQLIKCNFDQNENACDVVWELHPKYLDETEYYKWTNDRLTFLARLEEEHEEHVEYDYSNLPGTPDPTVEDRIRAGNMDTFISCQLNALPPTCDLKPINKIRW